jgi:hypothetical protein
MFLRLTASPREGRRRLNASGAELAPPPGGFGLVSHQAWIFEDPVVFSDDAVLRSRARLFYNGVIEWIGIGPHEPSSGYREDLLIVSSREACDNMRRAQNIVMNRPSTPQSPQRAALWEQDARDPHRRGGFGHNGRARAKPDLRNVILAGRPHRTALRIAHR